MGRDPSEIRFGMVAVQKGFIKPDRVVEAFEVQVNEDLTSGRHRPLGKILVDLGHLSEQQLNEVLRDMGI